MARDGLKLYNDWLCKNTGQIIVAGAAAAFGDMSSLDNWYRYETSSPYPIYFISGRAAGSGAFVLSGGDALYNNSVPQTIPTGDNIETDRSSNNDPDIDIYNPFFLFHDEESAFSICLQIFSRNSSGTEYNVRCSKYTQTPETGTRETWNYFVTGVPSRMDFDLTVNLRPNYDILPNQNQVKVYRLTIGSQLLYMFAFGVSADGTYSIGSNISNGTWFVAFPAEYFAGMIPQNYAGDETETNSEEAFNPTIPYRGSVESRDLTGKENPFGFNQGNGLVLCVLEYDEYAKILQGIYCGTAESVLNRFAQMFSQLAGGNTHRPIDEVNAIIDAIVSCHMVPAITGFVSGSHSIKTIAGYHILGGTGYSDTSMSVWTTDKTIFTFDTKVCYIQRRLYNFLDFEPYTSMVLHIPFMPPLDLKPSLIYGNGIKLHYTIDIFTGVLSCDVIIIDNNQEPARSFVLATLQSNVKTDIPIMGNAANASAFGGITSAIIGSMGGKNDSAIIAAGVNAADDLSKIGTGNAAGKTSISGVGAYMSPRQPYVIITRPMPQNPPKYAELNGFVSNKSGVVGDFTGYSVFESVDLSGIAATESEKQEIENLLKGGVFV